MWPPHVLAIVMHDLQSVARAASAGSARPFEAPLDVQVKPLEEDKAGKRKNAKALHIEHCLTTQLSKLPKAFTGTNSKEAAMLEYVDSWAAVLRSLYPYRRY